MEVLMEKTRWAIWGALIITLFFLIGYVLEVDSWARVGGGMSSGSRGSRSFSSPSRPSPGPSQSYGSPTRPMPPAQQPFQQPGGGGFFRGMLGGIAGGFLGSMLFRSLGWGGFGNGTGGGIGFFEIALLALVLFLLYRFIKRRREAAVTNSYYQETGTTGSAYQQSYGPDPTYGTVSAAPSESDSSRGYAISSRWTPILTNRSSRTSVWITSSRSRVHGQEEM